MTTEADAEYTYLEVPPMREMRGCVGLVMAGMAARARIGVGGLDEAVETLESLHSDQEPTNYRFSMAEDRVVAEIEDPADGEAVWRTVVELVS
ncbi:MAG TPA: hypothetical protein VHM16_03620 [Rubrobacteraceae bacterium]|nr:hypothetical protein [Rubrobacteraceae bacterium]